MNTLRSATAGHTGRMWWRWSGRRQDWSATARVRARTLAIPTLSPCASPSPSYAARWVWPPLAHLAVGALVPTVTASVMRVELFLCLKSMRNETQLWPETTVASICVRALHRLLQVHYVMVDKVRPELTAMRRGIFDVAVWDVRTKHHVLFCFCSQLRGVDYPRGGFECEKRPACFPPLMPGRTTPR